MTDAIAELQDEVRSVGLDHQLPPADRYRKLTALRSPIAAVLGEIDRYRAGDQNLREAGASEALKEVEWVRRNASLRDRLIEEGEMEPETLDEMGILSHAELDRLEEEGLLEEAAGSIAQKWHDARKPTAPALPAVAPAPAKPQPAAGQQPTDDPEDDPAKDAEAERTLGSLTDYVGARSEQAERVATPVVQQVVEQEGGQLANLAQRLKPRASIRSKIKRRRDTMPLASDDERATSIPDGARYTAVFPDAGYNQGTERVLGALAQKGFKQQEFQNFWADDGYAGLLTVLRAPGGTLVEVVFHTPESLQAQKANAPIVARFAASQDPHERWELWQEMTANAQKAPPPKGAAELGTTQQDPGGGVDPASGLPTSGDGSFHSVVAPEQLQAGDRAQDPLHGGVVTAHGPAKTVSSVESGDDATTVRWDDGSSSKFQPGSSVKKLRGGGASGSGPGQTASAS